MENLPPKRTKRRVLRPWVLPISLVLAALFGWALYEAFAIRIPEPDPYELSRADGRPRFYRSQYARKLPAGTTFRARLVIAWMEFKHRHSKKNPAAWSFPAAPVKPCSIHGLLNQCMEVTGTRYFVAVEVAGGIDFGATNVLSGAQWVAAFEDAIGSSSNVICYDYATKRNFEDSLLLIREKPDLVKVVPRSKLETYQKAGLINRRYKPPE